MRIAEFIVLTAPGVPAPDVAIAACRAGALGILDLEHADQPAVALAAVSRLARFTSKPFGVKLGPNGGSIAAALLQKSSVRPYSVLLAGGDHADLRKWIAEFRRAREPKCYWRQRVTRMRCSASGWGSTA